MTNEGAAADASARTENVDAAVREADDEPVGIERNRGRHRGRRVRHGGLHRVVWEVMVRCEGDAAQEGAAGTPFGHWIGIRVSGVRRSEYVQDMYESLK